MSDTTINKVVEEILEPVFRLGYEHSDKDYAELAQALLELINNEKIEARIDENQRWANGYGQVLLDHPAIDDSPAFMAAKQDFEDRIKELKKGSNQV